MRLGNKERMMNRRGAGEYIYIKQKQKSSGWLLKKKTENTVTKKRVCRSAKERSNETFDLG